MEIKYGMILLIYGDNSILVLEISYRAIKRIWYR